MADNNVNKMTVVLDGDSKKLVKALKTAEVALNKFQEKVEGVGGGFSGNGSGGGKGGGGGSRGKGGLGGILATTKKIAAAMGVAFAAKEIVQFGKEAVALGAKLEGIENAFQLIEDTGKTSMLTLKEATRGAVDEITLMGLAVQANNFKIPLENLGKFFEFATIRAAQTGESVEHLTRSIVLGIGRKSPLILDNLGITLVRLKEAMGKVGRESATVADISAAVAKVASEETDLIKKLGLEATTTAQRLDKMSASFQNWKASLGSDIVDSKGFDATMGVIERQQAERGLNRMLSDLGSSFGMDEMDIRLAHWEKEQKGLSRVAAKMELVEDLQRRLSGDFQRAKQSVQGLFGNVQDADNFSKWADDAADGLKKMSENGEFLTFDLKTMQRAVFVLKNEEESRRNAELKGQEKLSNDRTAFLDKYKMQLEEIKTRYELGMINPVERAEAQNRVLKQAIVAMTMDVKGLGLTATKEYEAWNIMLGANNQLLAIGEERIKGQTDALREFVKEQIKAFGSGVSPDEASFLAQTGSAGFGEMGDEEISDLDEAGQTWLRTLNDIDKLQSSMAIDEQDAASRRLSSLNEYLETMALGGQEIPAWMLALRDELEGTIFDKNELQDMAQMWSALSTAMSQVAGVFKGDQGISSLIGKFAQLASVIAAVVAAQAAFRTLSGDVSAAPRAIAAAATAFTGLAGLIGSVTGGFGGGGSGMGYNAGLSRGETLHTEISGRNIKVVLDREGSFSDRRG